MCEKFICIITKIFKLYELINYGGTSKYTIAKMYAHHLHWKTEAFKS